MIDDGRPNRPCSVRRHVSGGGHGGKNHLFPRHRAVVIAGGRQAGRRLDEAGKHRRLRQRQPLGLAIEIVHRRRAQPVDIVTEIGVREIALQNLILGQPGFQPERDRHFLELAADGAVQLEIAELGKLLRDRAAALLLVRADIGPQRARYALRIDAPMGIETPVLDRHEGLLHMIRKPFDLNRFGHDRPLAGNDGAIARFQHDLRRHQRLGRAGHRHEQRKPADQQHQRHQPRIGRIFQVAPAPMPAQPAGLRLLFRWRRDRRGRAAIIVPLVRGSRIGRAGPTPPHFSRSVVHPCCVTRARQEARAKTWAAVRSVAASAFMALWSRHG